MVEVLYLSVPFEEVKEIFPYARVVNGRAILPLAQIKYLKGVHDIEVIGAHDADLLIAELQERAGAEDTSPAVDEGVAAGGGGDPVEVPASDANTASDVEPVTETQAEVIEQPTADAGDGDPQEVENNE